MNQNGYTIPELIIVVASLLVLVTAVGLIWTMVHFIVKAW